MLTSDMEKRLEQDSEFDLEMVKANLCPDLKDFFEECLRRAGISRKEIITALNMDRSYGYQVLNGTRIPTRDCLVHIGLFLRLSVEDFQRMLNLAGRPSLYVKNIFDAKVFYAIKHRLAYEEAVSFIWETVG